MVACYLRMRVCGSSICVCGDYKQQLWVLEERITGIVVGGAITKFVSLMPEGQLVISDKSTGPNTNYENPDP